MHVQFHGIFKMLTIASEVGRAARVACMITHEMTLRLVSLIACTRALEANYSRLYGAYFLERCEGKRLDV
jgi:hypothetical protein